MATATKTENTTKGSAFEWPLIKRLFSYTRPYRGRFVLVLALTLLSAALSPLIPYVFQYTLDKPTLQGDVMGVRNMILLSLGLAPLILMGVGGLLYSVGVGFYAQKALRFRRAVWHGHVVAAAAAHRPVTRRTAVKYSQLPTCDSAFTQRVKRLGKWISNCPRRQPSTISSAACSALISPGIL